MRIPSAVCPVRTHDHQKAVDAELCLCSDAYAYFGGTICGQRDRIAAARLTRCIVGFSDISEAWRACLAEYLKTLCVSLHSPLFALSPLPPHPLHSLLRCELVLYHVQLRCRLRPVWLRSYAPQKPAEKLRECFPNSEKLATDGRSVRL